MGIKGDNQDNKDNTLSALLKRKTQQQPLGRMAKKVVIVVPVVSYKNNQLSP